MKGKNGISGTQRALLVALALVLLAAGAFLLRLVPFFAIPSGEGYPIVDIDSLYHLRVAQLIAHDFPHVPEFDYYLNFPLGARVQWPFLQDLTTAAVARALGLGEDGLQAVCFFFPAVMGALAPVFLYFLARHLGLGRRGAFVAAAFSSLPSLGLQYTFAGNYDHHAADYLLLLVFLHSLSRSWKERGSAGAAAGTIAVQAGVAGSTVLLFLNWLGAVVSIALVVAATLLSLHHRRREPFLGPWMVRTGVAFAVAAVMLAGVTLAAYGPGRLMLVSLDVVSLFQPVFLLAAAAFLFAAGVLAGIGPRVATRARLWGSILVFLGCAWLLLAPGLAAVSNYLSGGNRFLSIFSEYLPSFFIMDGVPRFSFLRGVYLLSGGLFLVPPAFLIVLSGRWRADGGDELEAFPRHLLLVLLGGLSLLALWQSRWGLIFGIASGLSGGIVLTLAWRWARARVVAWRTAVAAGATLLIAGAFAASAAEVALDKWEHPFWGVAYPLRPTLEWMEANTPVPSDYYRPSDPPLYGVLSLPLEGNAIITLGRRPSVAVAFGNTLPGRQSEESLRVLDGADAAALRAYMLKNRLRYLLLPDPRVVDWAGTHLLGREEGERPVPPVTEVLWRFTGSAWEGEEGPVEGAPYWRLIWEDEEKDWEVEGKEPDKLFELVPGAELAGTAPPGSWVSARLTLATHLRPEVPWQGIVRADGAGRFALVVPYPTDRASGSTRPLGPYQVEIMGRKAVPVSVTEADVAEGRRVEVR